MKEQKRFFIIDGNSLLHRAWHALPPLTAPDGTVVNAVYGFVNVIEKILDDFHPEYLAVAWDLPGKTFRHEEYAEYKGTRKKKEQELYDQIPLIKELLIGYGIPSISKEGFEGDDVVGTLAKKYADKDMKVTILSGDLDNLQLVDKNIEVMVFIKGISVTKIYDIEAVKERYGLMPNQLIDLKTLMGDSSDNIPGIAGVGKKTASTLLNEFKTIDGILQGINSGKVPEKFAKKFIGQEKVLMQMKKLVTIVCDLDFDNFKITDAKVGRIDKDFLLNKFLDYGFRKYIKNYSGDSNFVKLKSDKAQEEKGERIKNVKLSQLKNKQIYLSVKNGQNDLFGGSIDVITLSDGKSFYSKTRPNTIDLDNIRKFLQSADLVIGHDLKRVMHTIGFFKSNLFDVMIGAYLLSPGTRNFDLKTIIHEFLDKNIDSDLQEELGISYLKDLYSVIIERLNKDKVIKLAEDIEMPLIHVLFFMEKNGILIDKNKLSELSVLFGKELESLTKKIYKLAGEEFNIKSPAQLANILFEKLQLQTKKIKRTKTGFSTAASELEKLRNEHEIIPLISEYREFSKLKSTYVDALPKLIKEDSRIHTTFNQMITATGRLSSTEPNLQNIPTRTKLGNEIRKAFVSEKGMTLVSLDYSQFELRLAAHMSGDKALIEAFNVGADIHTRTASQILEKNENDITKSERSAAKAINFGILYGMGARHLARTTGFSQSEAKEFIEKYFNIYPGIQKYISDMKQFAHENGFVQTMFGRRRYLPDINSNIHMLIASSERMAVNMPVQGTQADLLKMAMLRVQKWMNGKDESVSMLLQVHDELIFEIDDEKVDKYTKEIKDIMENIYELKVPLIVDTEKGKNWGEMREPAASQDE